MTLSQNSKQKIRLDRFLSENLNIPRSQITQLIVKNLVFINGKIANKSGILLKFNDKIYIAKVESLLESLNNSKDSPKNLAPKSHIEIMRIYEDDDILVLNKPPFLATHGAPSLKEESLVEWLKVRKIQCSTISGERREGIIHRLDKQTSGAICVAKNNHAHRFLSAQLADKKMGRIYLAIIDKPLREDVEIECYLARNPKNRLKMSKVAIKGGLGDCVGGLKMGAICSGDLVKIPKGARYAKSKFIKLLLSTDGTKELICAKLFTGRTHQIRAHLESINRHIIGDELYGYSGELRGNSKCGDSLGKNDKGEALESKKYRVFLHSYLLYLTHPLLRVLRKSVSPLRNNLIDSPSSANVDSFQVSHSLAERDVFDSPSLAERDTFDSHSLAEGARGWVESTQNLDSSLQAMLSANNDKFLDCHEPKDSRNDDTHPLYPPSQGRGKLGKNPRLQGRGNLVESHSAREGETWKESTLTREGKSMESHSAMEGEFVETSHTRVFIDLHKKSTHSNADNDKNLKMLFLAPLFDDMKSFLEQNFDMEKVNEILRDLPNNVDL